MKRALKRLLILLVVLGLLGGSAWYFLSYNPELTAGFLAGRGASALAHGNYDSAVNWYTLAHRLTGEDEEIALGLAEAYRGAGNYTKAEYVLANAIADGGSAQVYLALCKTYIEQDKLLDAVTMLDQIADPEIRAQLDAQRQAAEAAAEQARQAQARLEENQAALNATSDQLATALQDANSALTRQQAEAQALARSAETLRSFMDQALAQ